MPILDFCDYSNVYIVVKGTINVRGIYVNNRTNKELAFTNNVPFRCERLTVFGSMRIKY